MAANAVSAARAVTPRAAPARRASAARAPSPRLAVRTAVASPSMPTPPALPVPDFLKGPLEEITKQIDANLPADAKRQVLRAQYTSAIGLRLAFFLTQGVLSSRVSGSSNIDGAAAASAIAKAVLDPNPRAKIPDAQSNLGNIVRNAADGRELSEDEAAEVSQFLSQHLTSIVNLFRQELEHLENGVYKFPYDLNPTTAPPEQWNPADVFSIARDTLRDQESVSDRRDAKRGQELLDVFSPDPERYPAYYLQNFHYQTDGWLTADSARLYDFQVETLFLGSADTMRRQVLPYVSEWMRGRDARETKILDVASGTGRFLAFLRDNWPELDCTALELSPHYLEAVRKTNERFTDRQKYPTAGNLRLAEANCEAMPFEDGAFDAVTNVYLFHEMPKEARRNAAREFARVLKPGGKLFFVDSAQVGDGAALGMEKAFDQALERFPMFNHEPYYRDYSLTDLKALFGEFGLVYEDSNVAWVSKCWCFTKREAEEVKAKSATLEATAQTEPEVETKAEEASESAAAPVEDAPATVAESAADDDVEVENEEEKSEEASDEPSA